MTDIKKEKNEITPHQAAKEFGCNRMTIYRWIDDGRLEYVRRTITNRIYISRTEFLAIVSRKFNL